jgi:glycosyltransferase involved in cell wall biosynthesis
VIKAPVPTVSVLIATYNNRRALQQAIDSVLWQSFVDFEAWVIGDGCTDDSAELVTSYGDPRLHWCNLPNNTGYQSAPHNEGLRRARGRYIAYLNHDDIWLPDHLERLVDALDDGDADVAYSILKWVLSWRDDYADIPAYPAAPLPPEASATMHRRELIDAIGGWRAPHEVYSVPRAEFLRRAQFAGKRFVLVPRLTVLKFGAESTDYDAAGRQAEYVARLRCEPDFAHTEVADLLVRAQHELERLPSLRRLRQQLLDTMRRWLVGRGIDPARLMIWRGRGHHIRAWRRAHGLTTAGAPQRPLRGRR